MTTSEQTDPTGEAIAAHGGLDRWNAITSVQVQASITGGVGYLKGRPDVLKDVVITAETQRERLTMDFPGQDKRTIFTPGRIVVETATGDVIEAREDPLAHFAGQSAQTPWDDIDVAYFSGEALWTYLVMPFLLRYPGVSAVENGEPSGLVP
jgi:hypothetical protein